MAEIWEWLNANAVPVGATATVLTALVACLALAATARDSGRRSRPYVVASLERDPHLAEVSNLTIANYGTTPAMDIQLQYDDRLPNPTAKDGTLSWYLRDQSRSPLPLLAPGQRVTTVWSTSGSTDHVGEPPESCVVTVGYRGGGSLRRHKAKFLLDTRPFSSLLQLDMPSAEQSLRDIATNLKGR